MHQRTVTEHYVNGQKNKEPPPVVPLNPKTLGAMSFLFFFSVRIRPHNGPQVFLGDYCREQVAVCLMLNMLRSIKALCLFRCISNRC